MRNGILAVLVVLLGVVIAYLSPALPIPDNLKPYLWIIVLLAVVALAAATYLQSRKERPSRFSTVWSKLSASLHTDIEASLASIDEARIASDPSYSFPTNLVGLPDFQLYGLHDQTVTQYDGKMGKALHEYVRLARALRESKNAYNQLQYADQSDENKLADARSRMYSISRELEQLIDSRLRPMIDRCDDEIFGDKSAQTPG